jgi:hypothetical protein
MIDEEQHLLIRSARGSTGYRGAKELMALSVTV